MTKFLSIALTIIIYTAVAFFGGYSYSTNRHETKDLKAEIVSEVKVNTKQAEVTQNAHVAETQAVVAKEKIRYVYKTIDKEVIKYVQTSPVANDFIADAQWVQLYNSSSLKCDPTSPACIARSEVSGGVTNAEALFIAKEQHELYHSCRATVEGIQTFYESLRKQINGDKYVESRPTEYDIRLLDEPTGSGSNP